jgi:two-component system, NtrC family, nitrogen regulation sensor histidine kinase GlnL
VLRLIRDASSPDRAGRRMTPYRTPYPVPGVVWASLPLPALLIGPDNRIAEVNPAGEIFLNASSRSLMGQPAFDRLAIDAPMDEALAARAGQPVAAFHQRCRCDHRRTPPRAMQHPGRAHARQPRGDPDDHLAPRYRRQAGPRHEVKSAAKSAIGMAEMLAHEIKNPLAGISGAAQLIGMNLHARGPRTADLIVEETRRIVKLLEQVEQFGNLRPPERRPVNIHDALDRARKSAMVGFAAHMQITEDYDPSLPPTFADPDQLMQVFLNLIKNAAEACQRTGEGNDIRLHTFYDLSLRLRGKDGRPAALPLQIEIIDDGPGIPPEIAADIFEPFVSGRENGTGLGLALVSKIISDHEGWISVDSVPGRTVFRVSLPVAPKDKKEKA